MPRQAWPREADRLVALQQELRHRAEDVRRADLFRLPGPPLIGGCFVAFARGEAGPGRPGDRAFAAAVVWEPGGEALLGRSRGGVPARSEEKALRGSRRLATAPAAAVAGEARSADVAPPPTGDGVQEGVAGVVRVPRQAADVVDQVVLHQAVGAAYIPGLLALREGPILAGAVAALTQRPDVLLVDASGADHPRRAGLAVHLGWALDLPTVGITRRPLRATGTPAERVRGRWSPLCLEGEVVAASVCTRTGAVPVVVHAGWRTDVETAIAVTLVASTEGARAPVPLQEARRVAREARDLAGA